MAASRRGQRRVKPLTDLQIATELVKAVLICDKAWSEAERPTVVRAAVSVIAAESEVQARRWMPLPEVARYMICEVVRRPAVRGVDVGLACEMLLDRLAAMNRYLVSWHDVETFVELIELMQAGHDASDGLLAWLSDALVNERDDGAWQRQPYAALKLRAVVLAPMTGVPSSERGRIRAWARAAETQLRRDGFIVHSPASEAPPERNDADISDEDVGEAARADVVLAFVRPPALGVGMLLAYSDQRSPGPHLLLLAEPDTEVSPIHAELGAQCELAGVTDQDSVSARIHAFVVAHRDQIEAHAASRHDNVRALGPLFDDFVVAWRANLAAGTPQTVSLARRRIDKILASVESFAGTSIAEIRMLGALLDPSFVTRLQHGLTGGSSRQDSIAPEAEGQLELFDAAFPASGYDESAVSNVVPLRPPSRPLDWQRRAWLTAEESIAGMRAAHLMGLSPSEAEEVILLAAGRRCDEMAMAAGGRSRLPLQSTKDWERLWISYRSTS